VGKLYISEYNSIPILMGANMRLQMPQEPGVVQVINISNASSVSAPFDARTKFIRLVSTQRCHIAFGNTPEASATSAYLPADSPELFGAGAGMRVAVIAHHEDDESQRSAALPDDPFEGIVARGGRSHERR